MSSIDYIKDICDSNGEMYIVGGAVRDKIYNEIHKKNISTKDHDLLARLIEPNKLEKILKKYGHVKTVGITFGVIKFKPKNIKKEKEKEEIDIALPRTEISTGPGYKDFEVKMDPYIELEEDFSRRDSPINAIAYRIYSIDDLNEFSDTNYKLDKSRLIDPLNGYSDIENKIWKSIGDPYKRFLEDPTRIMRAIRQTAELGFILEENTKKNIMIHYKLLNIIKEQSAVRISNELIRMLKVSTVNVKFIFESGIGELIDLKKESLKYIHKIDNDTSIRVRIALLLQAHTNDKANIWTKQYELSACPAFSKTGTDCIRCINMFYDRVEHIENDYDMKKFMSDIVLTFVNKDFYIKDVLTYYQIINNDKNNDQLNILYEKNKDNILVLNNVKLNGNIMMEKLKLSGNQIKDMKAYLLDQIFLNNVANNEESLINFIQEKEKEKLKCN
jgi:tRNA nucleotidyltransferase/poly(A) polymerase